MSNQINDTNSTGGVVRLTYQGTSYLAYVVIDLNNSQQKKWAQTQKAKRQLIEEKFIGENEVSEEKVLFA